jgi:hypothetical protein
MHGMYIKMHGMYIKMHGMYIKIEINTLLRHVRLTGAVL